MFGAVRKRMWFNDFLYLAVVAILFFKKSEEMIQMT